MYNIKYNIYKIYNLLKELLAIEKSKDNKSSATKSYAEIVTSTKPPLKRISKLNVKKNNKNEKLNIKNYITEMITKDTNIHAKGITVKSENEVTISWLMKIVLTLLKNY